MFQNMRFLIRYDITGETFTVTGATCEECRAQADAECARRGWSVELVGSEPIDAPESRSVERRLKIMRGER